MATKTRCLAVDDHQVVRQGLEILFGDTDDLELVGTVGSGEDAVDTGAVLGVGFDVAARVERQPQVADRAGFFGT